MASAAPQGRLRPGPAVPRPRQGKDRLSSTACLTKPAGKAASLASLTGLRTAAETKVALLRGSEWLPPCAMRVQT